MTVTIHGTNGITSSGDLTLNNGAADGAQVTLTSSGYSNWNLDNYSGRFRAYYNATEYFTINSNGSIGVGTTGGSFKLDIRNDGSVSDVSAFISNTSTHNNVNNLYSVIPSQSFNTSSAHFAGQTAGTNTWLLYGNGTTSYSSDENLKKNIQTTRDGYLDDVSQLRVVKYQWKINPDDSPLELGLIAQEVEQVFPNLVQEERPLLENGTYGDSHKVIKGSVFQPILIKCVQELNTIVKEQQELIRSLTTRIETLEAK